MKTALLVISIFNLHLIAGSIINVTIVVNIKIGFCGDGYYQCSSLECIPNDKVCNEVLDCSDGSDERAFLCGGYCPTESLEKMSMKPRCFDQNHNETSCAEFVPPGTTVQLYCKDGYIEHPSSIKTVHCQKGGTWSDHMFKCEPICGKVIENESVDDKERQAPWHVTIYQLSQGRYSQICGGSIISNKAVLTAAYCFWNIVNETVNSPELYEAFAGKTRRNYYDKDQTAQKLIIKRIVVHPQYKDLQSRFQGDIAVLVLDKPIIFGFNIMPVCLNFDLQGNERFIESGLVGRVVGWGLEEDAEASLVIKIADVSTLDYFTCRRHSDESYLPLITLDKFCIGTVLTEHVCQGDGGSGFALPTVNNGTTKYYLRGLINNGIILENRCAQNTYIIVTDVLRYNSFFYSYAENID